MRLVTRSDFDGLICAVLLKDMGVVDSYIFVHPKDIQDGKIVIDENDVLANVPYFPGCGLWFDHHVSESDVSLFTEYKGASKPAKSCARIVYDYYGGKARFPDYDEMLVYVDKCDSGDLSIDEILEPKGWVLLRAFPITMKCSCTWTSATPAISASTRFSSRKAGCCSPSSWTRAPAWDASGTTASATIS
jgi:hypothetical protein